MSASRKRDIEEPIIAPILGFDGEHENFFAASLADLDYFAAKNFGEVCDYTKGDERIGVTHPAREQLTIGHSKRDGDTLVLFPTKDELACWHGEIDWATEREERRIARLRGWELQPNETP